MVNIDRHIIDFLRYSYPVTRLKHKNRFKKGIKLNGNNFFLPSNKQFIEDSIIYVVQRVYDIEVEKATNIVKSFYNF